MNEKIALGVDIGGGHITSSAVNIINGKILRNTIAESTVDNKGSKEDILKTWSSVINETISKLPSSQLIGIGIAIPGPFNYQNGIAMYELTDKYESLYRVDIEKELQPLINTPSIKIRFVNDASAFGIGTNWIGNAKGSKKSVVITLGTGFGSAFIANGLPVIDAESVPEQGCLWHLPYLNGIADDYFSTRWFENIYEKKTNTKVKGVKEIAELALMNNVAKEVFIEFADHFSRFLTPWFRKFEPEVLVIGGNIMKAAHLFLPRLKSNFLEKEIGTNIFESQMMEEAAIVGSAKLLDDTYWHQIKPNLPTL